jgi:hypothetical protein
MIYLIYGYRFLGDSFKKAFVSGNRLIASRMLKCLSHGPRKGRMCVVATLNIAKVPFTKSLTISSKVPVYRHTLQATYMKRGNALIKRKILNP